MFYELKITQAFFKYWRILSSLLKELTCISKCFAHLFLSGTVCILILFLILLIVRYGVVSPPALSL